MYFDSIRLYQFRNLENQVVKLSPVLNVLVGKNGQGKTNFLESVYLSLKAKSFRPANAEHFIRQNVEKSGAYVGSLIKLRENDLNLEFQLQEKSKAILLNKKRTSALNIQKLLPCILFSPESLAVIKSGPDARRQLLDDFLTIHDPSAVSLLQDYSKCLKARNKILKDYKQELTDLSTFKHLLAAINESFLPLAVELSFKRINALKDVKQDFNRIMKQISNIDVESSVDYVISDESALEWTREIIDEKLRNRLKELSNAEISSVSTLVGPHKHDIKILFDKNDSRYYCSQGQQRALILSFKMAQIVYHNRRYGVFPVLLLDDVLSELDGEKRSFLIGFLKENKAQTFITTTDYDFPELMKLEGIKLFKVQSGAISEVDTHKKLSSSKAREEVSL